MKKYKITYFINPWQDIEIIIVAKNKDEAIAYAKNFREDAFFIEEME